MNDINILVLMINVYLRVLNFIKGLFNLINALKNHNIYNVLSNTAPNSFILNSLLAKIYTIVYS